MEGDILRGHLDLLVVATVRGGASHGYAVIEALRAQSDGLFDPPEGTIYPVLHRLEAAGILASRWERPGRRRRRVYRLTDRGERWLADSGERWRRFSRGVTAVLGGAT